MEAVEINGHTINILEKDTVKDIERKVKEKMYIMPNLQTRNERKEVCRVV